MLHCCILLLLPLPHSLETPDWIFLELSYNKTSIKMGKLFKETLHQEGYMDTKYINAHSFYSFQTGKYRFPLPIKWLWEKNMSNVSFVMRGSQVKTLTLALSLSFEILLKISSRKGDPNVLSFTSKLCQTINKVNTNFRILLEDRISALLNLVQLALSVTKWQEWGMQVISMERQT